MGGLLLLLPRQSYEKSRRLAKAFRRPYLPCMTQTQPHPAAPDESAPLYTGRPSAETLDYLLRRRSLPLKQMGGPGPSRAQVETMLCAAMRVPDHGKMFPWYFIVLEGEARAEAGKLLAAAWREEQPQQAEPAKLDLEAERFLRAPCVVIAVSHVREGKKPQWEQVLSGGASCFSLCLAANALGFGTNWLTEWYSYSPAFARALGLAAQDRIAGCIYIGTALEAPEERPRPDPAALTTFWQPGAALNTGPDYGHPGMGFPRAGYKFMEEG
jgi:nitroreductase